MHGTSDDEKNMLIERACLQVKSRALTIKHSSETESGIISFENTAGSGGANTARKWTIQPRSFDSGGSSAIIAGYDAIVISSDASSANNDLHQQFIMLAEHIQPAAGFASGELRLKAVRMLDAEAANCLCMHVSLRGTRSLI